ncbi:hypothetical protein Bbelb_433280 [Branchiostoma belcheri]|nr:hypothetical protein Bbelb_433280 [Branchiostoma belcheri]
MDAPSANELLYRRHWLWNRHAGNSLRNTRLHPTLEICECNNAASSAKWYGLQPVAFDKVPHARLISKLEYYGIQAQGPTLNWLKAFLTNREQTVVVEGKASAPVKVASGVPQGTVLGPLLFLLYINDLPDQLDSNVRLFADDCLLYVEPSTQTDSQLLQKDLNTLEEWQSKWLMQFNPEKCYIMHITNKRTPHATSYQFCGQALAITKIHPYLGVTLTSGLKCIRCDRSVIVLNLSLSLLNANGVFLGGIPQKWNKTICTAVAAMLHYFFLAAFCWMLAEGWHMYSSLVRTNGKLSKAKLYIALGWPGAKPSN